MESTYINCPCGRKIQRLNNSEWTVKCHKCGRVYIRFFDGRNYKIKIEE